MARIESLNVLLDPTGKIYLQELYGSVIENVEKGSISSQLKNRNLSGTPTSGTVEAQRIAFAKSAAYGTARAAGAGEGVKMKPVTIAIDRDREIIEEIENKDISLLGVDGLMARRAVEHQNALIRELETSFFQEAVDAGSAQTTSETDPQAKFEWLVLQLANTKNNYVHGVPRNMIHVVLNPDEYSGIRKFINTDVNNANINTTVEEFGMLNGVTVWSSIDLPAGTKGIAMAIESIAEPVMADTYVANKLQLASAYSVELFFHYGCKAVMPDLIFHY